MIEILSFLLVSEYRATGMFHLYIHIYLVRIPIGNLLGVRKLNKFCLDIKMRTKKKPTSGKMEGSYRCT